jgi:hypothetical protein
MAASDPRFLFESPTPYDENRIGAAAVYCSDGRMGEQMDEFLHQGLSLPRYDRVACPGGPVCLSGRLMALWEARGVEDQLRFLMRVHQLKEVILIGHTGCAYYRDRLAIPEARMMQEQRADLDRAATVVRRIASTVEVSAYFAHRQGTRVRFERVPLGGAPGL